MRFLTHFLLQAAGCSRTWQQERLLFELVLALGKKRGSIHLLPSHIFATIICSVVCALYFDFYLGNNFPFELNN